MAANKFATMVHRNTNKITLILVYAILEWLLIILLLLNSLFSYLIIKFADYFGLKRPCLWCSRLDHIFEPEKFRNSYRSLVCEAHGIEISKLGYCSSHRRLAESQDMCEDCSPFSRNEFSKKFAFLPWMKKLGAVQDLVGFEESENCEEVLKCSCCGVSLDSKLEFPDHYMNMIKPSWEDLDYTQKGNSALETEDDGQAHEDDLSYGNRSSVMGDICEKEQGICENSGEKTQENSSFSVCDFDYQEKVAGEGERDDVIVKQQEKTIKNEDLDVSMDDASHSQPVTCQAGCVEVTSSEIQPRHLEFYIDQDDCQLIPVEFTGSGAEEEKSGKKGDLGMEESRDDEDIVMEFEKHVATHYELVVEERCSFEENVPLLLSDENEEVPKLEMLELRRVAENEKSSGLHTHCELVKEKVEQVDIAAEGLIVDCDSAKEELEQVDIAERLQAHCYLVKEVEQVDNAEGLLADCGLEKEENEEVDIPETAQTTTYVLAGSVTTGQKTKSEIVQGSDEALQLQGDEIEADVSIGTEIPDQEPIDDFQIEDVHPPYQCAEGDPGTSNANYHTHDDPGFKQAEDDVVEFRTLSVETSEQVINNHLSESNEIEEDKIPDTPTSIDSLQYLHKKFLLIDRRETGTEDSLDGSVISDIEASDGVLTVEKLKSALRSERKALNALYAELEEERNASAVAANQTMAMINRLQEEKAAVQMEALQYQRMMDEQSAYDQEALQLLNELMIKREKEKAELEKELELYRKRVDNYDAKEKMLMLKRRKESSTRSASSSLSCSNAEDSDGLSVDLNHEGKEDSFDHHEENGDQNTPPDAVLHLEESLADFEEERISILEELKALEVKLFTISDEEEQYFEDIKPIEHLYEENGNGYHENSYHSSEANGVVNGNYKEMNGANHAERKIIGKKAKRLLPLFDAAEAETEDQMVNGHAHGVESVALTKMANKFDMDSKKSSIEEEVDHVYERLQALEADREFFKHCITSLRKGDKGIELLQEILHNLRDLRNVEFRARNMEDGVLL